MDREHFWSRGTCTGTQKLNLTLHLLMWLPNGNSSILGPKKLFENKYMFLNIIYIYTHIYIHTYFFHKTSYTKILFIISVGKYSASIKLKSTLKPKIYFSPFLPTEL